MGNNSNKKTLIGIAIGAMLGIGGTLGSQTFFDITNSEEYKYKKKEHTTNFDIVPYDANGDVVITEHGKKYHYRWCHTLSKAKRVMQVSSSDALNAGLTPCSKCH